MEVKVGQVWQEVDNRFTRNIIVLGFDKDKIEIRGFEYRNGHLIMSRRTKASKERFSGKYGGYKLIMK